MKLLEEFQRVTRHVRCPICGRPDWCLVERANPTAPSRVVCSRVESRLRWKGAGWLHELGPRPARLQGRYVRSITLAVDPRVTRLAERAHIAATEERVDLLATRLGISAEALRDYDVGCLSAKDLISADAGVTQDCWSFPMRSVSGQVIGLRLRLQCGRKLAVRGSRNGLFLPRGLVSPTYRLVFAEGESDAAALHELGFNAIGRPGCTACVEAATRYTKAIAPNEVVIVADRDAVGSKGANELAVFLAVICPRVLVIKPPEGIKDARSWKHAGATTKDIEAAIAAASPVQIAIGGAA